MGGGTLFNPSGTLVRCGSQRLHLPLHQEQLLGAELTVPGRLTVGAQLLLGASKALTSLPAFPLTALPGWRRRVCKADNELCHPKLPVSGVRSNFLSGNN